MNYNKEIVLGIDEPKNAGSYVKEILDAHEKYNFIPAHIIDSRYPEEDYCLGFVGTKVDDVLVIFCALYSDSFDKETYVVGWYKNAIVYRRYETMAFDYEYRSDIDDDESVLG